MEAGLKNIVLLREAGELARARRECGQLLAANPDNPEVLREMAIIATASNQPAEAERLLLRIAGLCGEGLDSCRDLARFYEGKRDFIKAADWYRRATQGVPLDPSLLLGLAQCLLVTARVQEAETTFSACLRGEPGNLAARMGRGHARRMLGRGAASVEDYRHCLNHEATFDEACWSLASLQEYNFSDHEISLLFDKHKKQTSAQLEFAVARVLEKQGDFKTAWACYVAGNAAQKQISGEEPRQTKAWLRKTAESFAGNVLNRNRPSYPMDSTPVFIVGLPRTGSTLVEQILASHPEVEATAELPYLRELADTALHSPLPIDRLPADRLAGLGQQYLEATRIHRPKGAPYFIDKLPENFANVGFMHLMFPRALVVDVRRGALATCVANFRQFYAAGKAYAYDLDDLADIYALYLEIMHNWDTLLPGSVVRVEYEKLVTETEPQIRRILNSLGLPWDDRCLHFHQSDRVVATASSEQVRRPIYSDSLAYWRRYEPWLGDIRDRLAEIS